MNFPPAPQFAFGFALPQWPSQVAFHTKQYCMAMHPSLCKIEAAFAPQSNPPSSYLMLVLTAAWHAETPQRCAGQQSLLAGNGHAVGCGGKEREQGGEGGKDPLKGKAVGHMTQMELLDSGLWGERPGTRRGRGQGTHLRAKLWAT
jgi:hypothetical protein